MKDEVTGPSKISISDESIGHKKASAAESATSQKMILLFFWFTLNVLEEWDWKSHAV